jgi:transcriptional regulator with XRE-family HTH domain
MAGPDRKRLAAYVLARRLELGYKTQRELAAAMHISERTVGKAENGEVVSASTIAALDNALGWEPGSAARVLDGGLPLLRGQQAAPLRGQEFTDPAMQEAFDALASTGYDEETRRLMVLFGNTVQERRRRVG